MTKLLELVPGTRFPHRREVLHGSGVAGTHLNGAGSIPMQACPYRRASKPGKGAPPRGAVCDHRSCPISSARRAGSKQAGRIRVKRDGPKIGGIATFAMESDRDGCACGGGAPRRRSRKGAAKLQRRNRPCEQFSARILLALVDGQNRASSACASCSHFLEIREHTTHFAASPATRSSAPKTASRWSRL